MSLLARAVFAALRWRARRGLLDEQEAPRRVGVQGETYAYWYLRRLGYVMIARNVSFPGLPGEIDLVGYDGPVLVFIEVKTRRAGQAAPEEAVTEAKQEALRRVARAFLRQRRLRGVPWRFDVVGLAVQPGRAPEVRLHRDAFRPA